MLSTPVPTIKAYKLEPFDVLRSVKLTPSRGKSQKYVFVSVFFFLRPRRKGATWNVFFVSGVGGGTFIRNMDSPATSFLRSCRGRLAFQLQLVCFPASKRDSGHTSIVFTRLTWWWQTVVGVGFWCRTRRGPVLRRLARADQEPEHVYGSVRYGITWLTLFFSSPSP